MNENIAAIMPPEQRPLRTGRRPAPECLGEIPQQTDGERTCERRLTGDVEFLEDDLQLLALGIIRGIERYGRFLQVKASQQAGKQLVFTVGKACARSDDQLFDKGALEFERQPQRTIRRSGPIAPQIEQHNQSAIACAKGDAVVIAFRQRQLLWQFFGFIDTQNLAAASVEDSAGKAEIRQKRVKKLPDLQLPASIKNARLVAIPVQWKRRRFEKRRNFGETRDVLPENRAW
ncbi:hypothetical protein [Martelella soudanensis]|uniref:hypothetical protein n=1 Tax=Martelella sp. NC18 TaxID=2740297 RepID=UPI001FF02737|nr:hypothetical protein [Martelella sp. NC18]